MFRARALGSFPSALLGAGALHLGLLWVAPPVASPAERSPSAPTLFEAALFDDERPSVVAPPPEPTSKAPARARTSTSIPVAAPAPHSPVASKETPSSHEPPGPQPSGSGESAVPSETLALDPASDATSVPSAPAGLAADTRGEGFGRAMASHGPPARGPLAERPTGSGPLVRGPRLVRSPSCSDLFSRAALAREALAVVAVSASGTAELSRLLVPNAPPALIGASRKCVERVAFEPARDAEGHALPGVAKLRIRLAPGEG